MKTYSVYHIIFFALLAGTFTGCTIFQKHQLKQTGAPVEGETPKQKKHSKHVHHKSVAETNQGDQSTIMVGGAVTKPGMLLLGANGLRLGEAVDLAGGLRQNDAPALLNKTNILPPALKSKIENAEKNFNEIDNKIAALKEHPDDTPDKTKDEIRQVTGKQLNDLKAIFDGNWFSADVADEIDKIKLISYWAKYENNPNPDALENFSKKYAELKDLFKKHIEQHKEELITTTSQSNSMENYLVGLRRGSSTSALTYFFPYASVVNGFARDIPLRNQDVVRVSSMDELTLNYRNRPRLNIPDRRFVVTGLIESPGIRTAGHSISDYIDKSGQQKNPKEKIILLKNALTGQLVIQISRTTSTGVGRDNFVIPYNSTLIDVVNIIPGDEVRVIPFMQVPIIAETLLADYLNANPVEVTTTITKPSSDSAVNSTLKRVGKTYLRPIGEGLLSLVP